MKKVSIVKIGGKLLTKADDLNSFLEQFLSIDGPKILVHGGGVQASKLAERLGIQQNMIEGRRITDSETLDIAIMVYAGLENKKLTAKIQALGSKAIGLCGADGALVQSTKRPIQGTIDYGWVGDVHANDVDSEGIMRLLDIGYLPVFSAISMDKSGQLLNTNADSMAAVIASALQEKVSVSLLYCSDTNGILEENKNGKTTVDVCTKAKFESLTQSGQLSGGIFPKIQAAFAAKEAGVEEVALVLETQLSTYLKQGGGTQFKL